VRKDSLSLSLFLSKCKKVLYIKSNKVGKLVSQNIQARTKKGNNPEGRGSPEQAKSAS